MEYVGEDGMLDVPDKASKAAGPWADDLRDWTQALARADRTAADGPGPWAMRATPKANDALLQVIHASVMGQDWPMIVRAPQAASRGDWRVVLALDHEWGSRFAGAPGMAEVGRTLREACGDLPLVFHNAPFDLPFLVHLFREAGAPPLTNPIVDTLGLARGLFGNSGNKLTELQVKLQLPSETAHRALGDTRTTARVFLTLAGRWEQEKGVRSIAELAAASQDVMRATARR